jgi:DNA-binding winged helix-turn-helix (wHTH) protein
MGEQGSISGVWREALAIIRRYPSAVVVPGVVLGALAEAPTYLIADRLVLDQILTYLAAAFAYYLYLAYAEELTTDYERGEDLIASRSRLARLLRASSFVPRVLVAALLTVSLTSAATALLVVPGVWLYTRWSLSVPVICKEDTVDPSRHEATWKGAPLALTPTEFRLLLTLARRPGRVFGRLELLERIQGEAFVGYERTVDAHVKNLRKKLAGVGGDEAAESVVTVPGVGYKLGERRA